MAEVFEAAAETQALAGSKLPVLWDFRRCKLLEPPEFAARQLVGLVANTGEGAFHSKRAFVVASEQQQKVVEQIVSYARAPWPWVIFYDLEEALEWIDIGVRVSRAS
ncbi:MAG: hypothetical protein ACFHXK_07245 [bacterium]